MQARIVRINMGPARNAAEKPMQWYLAYAGDCFYTSLRHPCRFFLQRILLRRETYFVAVVLSGTASQVCAYDRSRSQAWVYIALASWGFMSVHERRASVTMTLKPIQTQPKTVPLLRKLIRSTHESIAFALMLRWSLCTDYSGLYAAPVAVVIRT